MTTISTSLPSNINIYIYIYTYIYARYCDGGSLGEKVKMNKWITEYGAAKIIEQVLLGLCYCHSRNIIHRDIKLNNILFLTFSHSSIKVIDFGLSIHSIPDYKIKGKAGTVSIYIFIYYIYNGCYR